METEELGVAIARRIFGFMTVFGFVLDFG